jgi:hypothetical protein
MRATEPALRAFRALLLPLLPLQGWRVTAEVVAVLEPSCRRESVVGERTPQLPSQRRPAVCLVCLSFPGGLARFPPFCVAVLPCNFVLQAC